MTVNEALEIMDFEIGKYVETVYNKNKDPMYPYKDSTPHPILENPTYTSEAVKLKALKFAIYNISLRATPLKLLEPKTSSATLLKPLNATHFIRVPNTPTVGGELDIDEGLTYPVIYTALQNIYSGLANNEVVTVLLNTHSDNISSYLEELINYTPPESAVRFSADGTTWRDDYQAGDSFISYKLANGQWSSSVPIGVSEIELSDITDLPNFEPNKIFATNNSNNVVLIDPPASGSSPSIHSTTFTGGTYYFQEAGYNGLNLSIQGDTTFDIYKDSNNNANLIAGKTYNIFISTALTYTLTIGNNITVASGQTRNIVDNSNKGTTLGVYLELYSFGESGAMLVNHKIQGV